MKKTLLFLAVISLFILSSCGGDEDDDMVSVGLIGTVSYDGTSYSIANGIFSLTIEDGNAEGEFFLADGVIEPTATGVSTGDSEIIISIVATSAGTTTLSSGNYQTSTNVPAQYADIQVTTSSGSKQAFTGGTVNISGSGNTYSITFDVPFGQGIELSGTVNGTYESR
ncbi:hypothetical protein [Ekhidna sp.]|uniref:hypothetical protein n=1 Tax=Ekhidna sp. TaxID=2608089 RepID=UPI003BA923D6